MRSCIRHQLYIAFSGRLVLLTMTPYRINRSAQSASRTASVAWLSLIWYERTRIDDVADELSKGWEVAGDDADAALDSVVRFCKYPGRLNGRFSCG